MMKGRTWLRFLEGASWIAALALVALVVTPLVAPDTVSELAVKMTQGGGQGASPATLVDERINFLWTAVVVYAVVVALCLASFWASFERRRAQLIVAGEEASKGRLYVLSSVLLAASLWLGFHLSGGVFFGVERALQDLASKLIQWSATPAGGVAMGLCIFLLAVVLAGLVIGPAHLLRRIEGRNVSRSLH